MLAGCGLLTRRLPESVPPVEPLSGVSGGHTGTSIEREGGHFGPVLRVMSLVFIEGAVVVGAVLVLPALAEAAGHVHMTSAATVGAYGLAMWITGAVMRRLPPLTTLQRRCVWPHCCCAPCLSSSSCALRCPHS